MDKSWQLYEKIKARKTTLLKDMPKGTVFLAGHNAMRIVKDDGQYYIVDKIEAKGKETRVRLPKFDGQNGVIISDDELKDAVKLSIKAGNFKLK